MTDLLPSRRTVAKGAAWSLPVLAVGAPALALRASYICPTLPQSGWSTTLTSGSVSGAVGTGGSGWVTNWNSNPPIGSATYAFTSGLDNSSTSATAVVTTTIQIPVESGVNYSFSTLNIGAGYGNNNSSTSAGQSISVAIGGVTMFSSSTRGDGALTIGSRQNYSTNGSTYTAAANGTIAVTFTFTLAARSASGATTSDDIVIALPTLVCS